MAKCYLGEMLLRRVVIWRVVIWRNVIWRNVIWRDVTEPGQGNGLGDKGWGEGYRGEGEA